MEGKSEGKEEKKKEKEEKSEKRALANTARLRRLFLGQIFLLQV